MQDLISKIAKNIFVRHFRLKNSAGPRWGRRCRASVYYVFSWNTVPQLRQVMVILPLPRGTRRVWEQVGHLK